MGGSSAGSGLGGSAATEVDGGVTADAGDEPYTVPSGCPVPAPVAVPGQSIAIQSINFDTSEVVLRNVSTQDVTITGTRQGWQWCNVPAYWYLSEVNVTLRPGQTFAFLPNYNQSGIRQLFRGDDGFDTNEMGIYTVSGSFNNPELIRAFVSWGEGAQLETRESVGVQSGLWTLGERVEIGPNDSGFIATGPTDRGAGYTSVRARCLVAPRNP
ncbi:MAG: hypothetical protein RL033_823 [Pseudomonadota bacterium]|jgi:hypothetical protein